MIVNVPALNVLLLLIFKYVCKTNSSSIPDFRISPVDQGQYFTNFLDDAQKVLITGHVRKKQISF